MKESIINAYIEQIQDKIDTYQFMIQSLAEDAQNDAKSSAGDKHETGLSMMHLEQEKLNAKLSEVLDQKKVLTSIDVLQKHQIIKQGSLVETENFIFLVAIALPQWTYQNKTVFGVSLFAPLAQQLIQKKLGDTLQIGPKKQTITNVE